jgi:DNA polymerase (family 10)
MRNKEVAAVLYMIADLLDIKGEKFKPNAYRRAARVMEMMEEDIEVLAAGQKLKDISGIGEAITEKTAEYLKTGKVAVLEELRKEIPQGVVEMLDIPGVGPKTAGLVWKELGIMDVEGLKKAVQEHRLLKLKGFGEKKEAKILRGIEFLAEAKKRTPIGIALPLAEEMVALVKGSAPVINMSYAGSLRRMRETVGDLDFLAVSSKREEVVRAFTSMPFVREIVVAGDTKATVILDSGIQADLRVLDEGSWGSGLQYFTGSKDHNVHLRTIAQRQGLKLSEYGVFRGEERIAGATEEDVYRSLGMQYIEPEMREDAGEIEAAQEGRLPRLLTMADVLGSLDVPEGRARGERGRPHEAERRDSKHQSDIGRLQDSPGDRMRDTGQRRPGLPRRGAEGARLRHRLGALEVQHADRGDDRQGARGGEPSIREHPRSPLHRHGPAQRADPARPREGG